MGWDGGGDVSEEDGGFGGGEIAVDAVEGGRGGGGRG